MIGRTHLEAYDRAYLGAYDRAGRRASAPQISKGVQISDFMWYQYSAQLLAHYCIANSRSAFRIMLGCCPTNTKHLFSYIPWEKEQKRRYCQEFFRTSSKMMIFLLVLKIGSHLWEKKHAKFLKNSVFMLEMVLLMLLEIPWSEIEHFWKWPKTVLIWLRWSRGWFIV